MVYLLYISIENKNAMKPLTLIFKSCLALVFIFLLFPAKSLNAQSEPNWLSEAWRTEQYPSNVFLIGYAQDNINKSESVAKATERVQDLARANLSESLLSSIKSVNDSYKKSVMHGDNETISETYKFEINVTSDLVLNGVRVESFVKGNLVYGFAHANKYEIIGYYKANLNMYIQQIEGFINTTKELEDDREKSKAKKENEKALPIFDKIKEAQGILSAIDKNIPESELKMEHSMDLYNTVIQTQARLAQGIIVYIETEEDLFSTKVTKTETGIKAILAENGCRFTLNKDEADFKVIVSSIAREYNYSNKVYFSYVDAVVKLYKSPEEKHIYENKFSKKGAHSKSYNEAALNAYNEVGKVISEKILTWINN